MGEFSDQTIPSLGSLRMKLNDILVLYHGYRDLTLYIYIPMVCIWFVVDSWVKTYQNVSMVPIVFQDQTGNRFQLLLPAIEHLHIGFPITKRPILVYV